MPRPGWCRLCTLALWSVMGFGLAAPLDIAHAAQQQPKVTVHQRALEPGEVQLMVGRGDTVLFESALNLDEEIAVIVEFSAPALLAPGAMPGVPAQQMMQFDSDLPRLEGELSRVRPALYQAGLSRIDHRYSRVFNGVALRARRRLLIEIGDLRYVARVHPDREVRTVLSESVPLIGADKLWETLGIRGEGTVIGIIDTGIDYTHPALGGGLGPSFKVIGGYDFVNDDSDPMDDHGHGTHVAGIAAGHGSEVIGVAPEAQLLGFKVLSAGGWGSFSDVIAGIERAVDPDQDPNTDDAADVINLSLGGPGDPDDPVSQAIDNVTAAGIVAVVAAGNSGAYQTIGSPGTARTAITVGATTKSDDIAWFSSRGPNTKTMSIKPDLAAPGYSISSAALGGGTIAFSGTSMATPHVAGLSALLRQLHPQWTPAMIKAALMQT
ncbi:MAG: S8 family serine peptidase, partial [Gemmatimonadales bacterium]